jgi:hypothetical protein
MTQIQVPIIIGTLQDVLLGDGCRGAFGEGHEQDSASGTKGYGQSARSVPRSVELSG